MIARLKPISRIDRVDRLVSFDELRDPSRSAAFLAGVFGFVCFMPYPAIGVGGNSALQMGNVATFLAILGSSIGLWAGVSLSMVLPVLFALLISTFKVLLIDGGDTSICFKSTVSWLVTLLTILAVQLHVPRHALSILTGIAVATLMHAAAGAYQVYSFSSGIFPLAQLYVNPSFLSVQDHADTIARWTQRPFGIFPEPSAMSSSLAPFVLFFGAICFNLLRMRQSPTQWQRALFAIAAAAGLGLIIISRSGHAAPTVAALLIFLGIWLWRSEGTMRTYLVVAILLGVVLPLVLAFAYNAMSARVVGGTDMGNDSWAERSNSLVLGFKAWSNHGIATGIFGLGPGVSSELINDATGISAVFSILFSFFYETGVVGLLALGWSAQQLMRSWRESGKSAAFAVIFIVWAIGITLTTCYSQLLPLWVALAWLASWNEICETSQAAHAPMRPSRSPLRSNHGTRVSPWTAPYGPAGSHEGSLS